MTVDVVAVAAAAAAAYTFCCNFFGIAQFI